MAEAEPDGDLRVRAAASRDAAAIAALAVQLGYDPGTESARRTLVERDPARLVELVAERAGVTVGWLDLGEVHALHDGRGFLIHGLVVDGAQRGRGIGRALLQAAEAWARAHGGATLRVRSNVVRGDAHRFYEQNGYRRLKSQHLFERRLD
jgi:GNAT superfamily N-acetyltransferase